MDAIRRAFEADGDGLQAAGSRAALVDELIRQLWSERSGSAAADELAVVALGGYGRGELFPASDVDLLFCSTTKGVGERAAAELRAMTQALWDAGLRLSATTRTISECERFEAGNAELALSLLDRRQIAGDAAVFAKLDERIRSRLIGRDAKPIRAELLQLTRDRHGRYGDTLFHLEPNIKECPGGLRDAHVCAWLRQLGQGAGDGARSGKKSAGGEFGAEFPEGVAFMAAVRCFLHFRAGRDDNTLDWQAQDEAAGQGIGIGAQRVAVRSQRAAPEGWQAAAWMRAYFRHARTIERRLEREWDAAGTPLHPAPGGKVRKLPAGKGFRLQGRSLVLESTPGSEPAEDAETVLRAFAAMAQSGVPLAAESEERILTALPEICATLEVGPGLWRRLCGILTAPFAGAALRSMHALGILELILPEFHGIDALVIRDAYHRYTVDEHTFVVIDTLHALAEEAAAGAPEWRLKFGSMIRELQNPGLLYLAALLHDTGKGRLSGEHAVESARLAKDVLARLEMDPYDTSLVLRLIENHLEMSAALRRDIFDTGTVRAFAARVQTHEALRMLTLFTYADIHAVHPDALTPWKAENLWRLSMNAANQLDRNVDEERVHTGSTALPRTDAGLVAGVLALLRGRETEVQQFLEGFPERYLKTRSAASIHEQFEMTRRLEEEPFQIALHAGTSIFEITLVTRDRPRLFADVAAALAGWGMNVVTADAFSNAAEVVVDSFRFVDTFRTLELNQSERERFVASVREVVSGRVSVDALVNSRRRGKRRAARVQVATRIDFDQTASSHSTVLQIVAQDVPGLLRAVSSTLSATGCNVEVALVDTEGEMAIDVFYLTREGRRLTGAEEAALRLALAGAIEANAR